MLQEASKFKANDLLRCRIGILNPFLLANIPNVETILDVGCGSGFYHQLILDTHPTINNIVGIDQSQGMLVSAVHTDKCEYYCMDILAS